MSSLVREGASLLINVANEAWFAESSLPQQNLDAMRIRAMETGREGVRVANMGPGAIINTNGSFDFVTAAKEAGATRGWIQPRTGLTPFVQIGENFILFISIIIVFGLALLAIKKVVYNEK